MLPAQKYFEQGAKLLANKTFLKLFSFEKFKRFAASRSSRPSRPPQNDAGFEKTTFFCNNANFEMLYVSKSICSKICL